MLSKYNKNEVDGWLVQTVYGCNNNSIYRKSILKQTHFNQKSLHGSKSFQLSFCFIGIIGNGGFIQLLNNTFHKLFDMFLVWQFIGLIDPH